MLIAGVYTPAAAQSPTVISGRVVRKTGEPISGATVAIEGTQYTTVSADDGRYTLSVPVNRVGTATAVTRSIGYRSQRQTVNLNGTRITLDWSLSRRPSS